jgi:alpha-1,6-mannosyltransferase
VTLPASAPVAPAPPIRRRLDLATGELPPVLRPAARLAVLDATEWYAPTSGGIRTYLQQKGAYVAQRPWLRHALAVPAPADGVLDGDGVRAYEFGGRPIPGNAPYRFLLSVERMRRVLDHERPDVVELGSPALVPWVVFRALRGREIPVVNFFHSHFPQLLGGSRQPRPAYRRLLMQGAWWYARAMDRRVTATIAASRFTADALAEAGVPNVERIPLGVDLAHFTPARRAHAAATRAAAGLPAERPLVLFVGRFAHEKELDVLVDAWPMVEARTDAALVLAGDGPERARLQARSRGTRVHWLPFIADQDRLADLHAAADVYVASSPHETFGLSPLEAMACGTHVLAADGGAVREHVVASGAGALFPPGDAGALAEQLVTLLARDREHDAAHARAYAEREHDWAHVFDRVFALHERVRR